MSGWNDEGRAAVDVGATSTVLKPAKRSDWTTTPFWRPSAPRPGRLAVTEAGRPRREPSIPVGSECFHLPADGGNLGSVASVPSYRENLVSDRRMLAPAVGGFPQCAPNRVGIGRLFGTE